MSSAKQSCDVVSSTASNISSLSDFFQSLNPFRSSNDIRNEIRNNLSVELTENDVIDIKNSCLNSSNIEQINILSTKPECISLAQNVCAVGNDPIKRGECVNNILSIQNISQINKSKLEQNCMIDSLISKISKKEADVNNISAILALQQAKGPMATNNINNAICNNLNTSLSTDTFIKSYNSCINEVSNKQQNFINTCGNKNISQANFYESMNDCLARNGVVTNSELIGKIINDVSSDTNQTASLIPFDITLIVIVCIIAVCCCILLSLMVLIIPQIMA
ncbi:hypothetical protein Catovirus_2_24 [Catovirus CTV1]|uniref:Uncharacterized protein n=1 Tax=Catovirus CTV1 TaxID=1977631 RepID=A0A1V0SBI2_9VIRU|nr:hypothetical protein Catovirus_2_24 [Catovirus CTV1]